jgi:hypothetical protein
MKLSPVARLALTAVLFVAWLGWLGYLVVTAAHPIVLSRPQFLMSDVDVIARVNEDADRPDPLVRVESTFWSRSSKPKLDDQDIRIQNLDHVGKQQGWQGPGVYILPLVKQGSDYVVASLPRSPGFEPAMRDAAPRIYLRNEQTLSQLQAIRRLGEPLREKTDSGRVDKKR